jgi:hypothetical protein
MSNPQPLDSHFELGPTYKSLFLGACLVIGGGGGWWVKDLHARVAQQDDRLAQFEAGAIERRIKIAHLEQLIIRLEEGHRAQDRALYELERSRLQSERAGH